MLYTQIPTRFPIAFANNAAPGFTQAIPQNSQIGVTPGAASLFDGFPPLTFQPTTAGGIPPWGRDFNGLFNQITAWVRFNDCAGAFPTFDSSFSTSIGGYPRGAVLNAVAGVTVGSPQGGNHLWFSLIDNNSTNPDTVFAPTSWIPFPGFIDSSVSYTVGGTGAQFSDLSAAYSYLSRFAITASGAVTLQLVAGVGGSAQSYATSITLSHPNGNRITIAGQALTGSMPAVSAFTATGVNVTADNTANLALLRGIYNSELHFVSGATMTVIGSVNLQNILFTGDNSGTNPLLVNLSSGFWNINNVSGFNSASYGIVFSSGNAIVTGTNFWSKCVNGCVWVRLGAGVFVQGNLLGYTTAGDGVFVGSGGIIYCNNFSPYGVLVGKGCGTGVFANLCGSIFSSAAGISAAACIADFNNFGFASNAGSMIVQGSEASNNTTAFYTALCGSIDATSSTGSSNTTAFFAQYESAILRLSSTTAGASTPAVGSVGNGNATVQ